MREKRAALHDIRDRFLALKGKLGEEADVQRLSRQLPEGARLTLGGGRGAVAPAEIAERARVRLRAGRVAARSAA